MKGEKASAILGMHNSIKQIVANPEGGNRIAAKIRHYHRPNPERVT